MKISFLPANGFLLFLFYCFFFNVLFNVFLCFFFNISLGDSPTPSFLMNATISLCGSLSKFFYVRSSCQKSNENIVLRMQGPQSLQFLSLFLSMRVFPLFVPFLKVVCFHFPWWITLSVSFTMFRYFFPYFQFAVHFPSNSPSPSPSPFPFVFALINDFLGVECVFSSWILLCHDFMKIPNKVENCYQFSICFSCNLLCFSFLLVFLFFF